MHKMEESVFIKTRYKIAELILPHTPASFLRLPFNGQATIEPTNICNFRCPLCPTPKLKREKGILSYENFKTMMKNFNLPLKVVAFNWAGEPLLNPELFDIVHLAESKGIRTTLSTNVSHLDKYKYKVFESQLSVLKLAIDGATAETYSKFRVGGNFDKVIENAIEVCRIKKQHNFEKPYIVIQLIVTKDSEREIDSMKILAKSIGADQLQLKSLSLGSLSTQDMRAERAKDWLPEDKRLSRYRIVDGKVEIRGRKALCPWLRKTVIYWNGDVGMCCHDYEGTMVAGNILKKKFKDIWNSKRYRELRKIAIRQESEVCQNCQVPLEGGSLLTFQNESKN